MDGMPWQMKAVALIGVPSAIAVYLVWAMVSTVVSSVDITQRMMSEHVASTSILSSDQTALRRQNEEIIRVLRTSCVNAAKDNTGREQCLR